MQRQDQFAGNNHFGLFRIGPYFKQTGRTSRFREVGTTVIGMAVIKVK